MGVRGGVPQRAEFAELRRIKAFDAELTQNQRRTIAEAPTLAEPLRYHNSGILRNMECVYLLQEIDFDGSPTGLYKIGRTTKAAEQRKRQYQAGNARRVDVYATIEVYDSQAVETDLHRRLSTYRLALGGGDEWFNFQDVNIDRVVHLMAEYKPHIPQPIKTKTYTRYREPTLNDLPPVPTAIVMGLVLVVGAGMLGSFGANSKLKEHYRQAYIPLETYTQRSGTGQYHTAAINFKRFSNATPDECLKKYGVNMASASLEADETLRETKNYKQAWDTFRGLQKEAWIKAKPCQQKLKDLESK